MKHVVRFTTAAVILALGLVVSSAVLSKFFLRIRHDKEISVKGYAEMDVTSDVGTFSCSVSVRDGTLEGACTRVGEHAGRLVAFLIENGFAQDEIAAGTLQTSKVYLRDERGNMTNQVEYHEAYQWVRVTSPEVNRIRDVSRSVADLMRQGMDLSIGSPEYFVSTLEDIKLDLMARATQDGYRRAVTLAENSLGTVGALRSARQGVFQITAPNSTETSGYGIYDTSTIDKTVKAVVTLEYAVE